MVATKEQERKALAQILCYHDALCVNSDAFCTEAIETCPWCGGVNDLFNWDTRQQGFVVNCCHCGHEIFLCDECRHSEDNLFKNCDWEQTEHDDIIEGHCFRGVTINFSKSSEKGKCDNGTDATGSD